MTQYAAPNPNSGRVPQPGGYAYTGQAPVVEDASAYSDAAVADEVTELQEQEQPEADETETETEDDASDEGESDSDPADETGGEQEPAPAE